MPLNPLQKTNRRIDTSIMYTYPNGFQRLGNVCKCPYEYFIFLRRYVINIFLEFLSRIGVFLLDEYKGRICSKYVKDRHRLDKSHMILILKVNKVCEELVCDVILPLSTCLKLVPLLKTLCSGVRTMHKIYNSWAKIRFNVEDRGRLWKTIKVIEFL